MGFILARAIILTKRFSAILAGAVIYCCYPMVGGGVLMIGAVGVSVGDLVVLACQNESTNAAIPMAIIIMGNN